MEKQTRLIEKLLSIIKNGSYYVREYANTTEKEIVKILEQYRDVMKIPDDYI